ncbi:hypothetical protein H0H81_011396, partial [Sphagnurus paluster]
MDTAMNKLQNGKYYIRNSACESKVGLAPSNPSFQGYAIIKEQHNLQHHELPFVT